MKIFAKRKKRDASRANKSAAPTKRTSFESDPIVEQLLKKDPSEWNAKEKRMVKRHQQRKAETGDDADEKYEAPVREESKPEESAVEKGGKKEVEEPEDDEEVSKESKPEESAVEKGEKEEEEEQEDIKEVSNESKPEDSTDSDNDSDIDQEEDAIVKETDTIAVEDERPVAETEVEAQTPPPSTTEAETDCDKVDPAHAVYNLLDQLNSKTKRTLSRKLDRDGAKALPEVEQEVNKLLGITDETSKKRGADALTGSSSKKKKKKKVDVTSLTAEERLRREEQRKKQKEAAERRANGEMTSGHHKHPLNSERRRANRRKSKWKNTFVVEDNKNHNASGFLARKDVPRRN